jgi:hypothetical protein
MTRIRPFGITLLALVQIISGLQFWLLAIASRADTTELQDALSENAWIAENVDGVLFWSRIIYVVLGLLAFALAYGYLNGSEWAGRRGASVATFAIVVAFLTMMLVAIPANLASPMWLLTIWTLVAVCTIMFNIAIIIFLGRPTVRAYFKSGR